MKCQECVERHEAKPRDAEWMLYCEVTEQLRPLCGEHWDELCHMEGEENLAFEPIDDVEAWVRMANEQLRHAGKRYSALLKEYAALRERPAGGPDK